MENTYKGTDRNGEIVTFFYLIFGHRVHGGMDADAARKEAYDAVTLRYGIGKGRLQNIISERNCSRKVNRSAFRENILSLIGDLTDANEEMDSAKERNEKLISLLRDALEHDCR